MEYLDNRLSSDNNEGLKLHLQYIINLVDEYEKVEKALDKICIEYLSKCKCCDECISEFYCIENNLRDSRIPKLYCQENIKEYLLKESEKQ